MKIKKGIFLIGIVLLSLFSCRTPTQKWIAGLTSFDKTGDSAMTIEILKVKAPDLSSLNYSVRVYPSKQWLENKKDEQSVQLNYQIDSCFYIRNAVKIFRPAMVQPIANGLNNCFEYLISFDVEPAMEGKNPELLYQDKYITKRRYTFHLNKR